MKENLKYEYCENCDKPKKDKKMLEARNTLTSMSSAEDRSHGIDHRIVLFGWKLRLASGMNHHINILKKSCPLI